MERWEGREKKRRFVVVKEEETRGVANPGWTRAGIYFHILLLQLIILPCCCIYIYEVGAKMKKVTRGKGNEALLNVAFYGSSSSDTRESFKLGLI